MGKKKKSFSKAILFAVILLSVTATLFYYIRLYRPTSFVHYSQFGIDIPVQYPIHGIDVSRYQEKISWKDVSAMDVNGIKLGFAFIKATEGTTGIDDQFKKNWKNIKQTDLRRGAYHYFIATKSGKAQAINFIETVALEPGDLPPVLDVEEAYGATATDIRQRVSDWLFMAERAYKAKPVIYTNLVFYKTYLDGWFERYPLWIAHYKEKHGPRIQRNWSFWQHNEGGHVSGINAYVDFNVFNGDSSAFEQLLIRK